MANRISAETIEAINLAYSICKCKAQVARDLGVSTYAVNKYLDPNWTPSAATGTKEVEALSDFNVEPFLIKDLAEICKLSEEEIEDLIKLQKEVKI